MRSSGSTSTRAPGSCWRRSTARFRSRTSTPSAVSRASTPPASSRSSSRRAWSTRRTRSPPAPSAEAGTPQQDALLQLEDVAREVLVLEDLAQALAHVVGVDVGLPHRRLGGGEAQALQHRLPDRAHSPAAPPLR